MEEKRTFNNNHPEIREGEMFLLNCGGDGIDYRRISWKTKRRGIQAYTITGEALKGYVPVFVKKKEYSIVSSYLGNGIHKGGRCT